jgi:hypothetical protein
VEYQVNPSPAVDKRSNTFWFPYTMWTWCLSVRDAMVAPFAVFRISHLIIIITIISLIIFLITAPVVAVRRVLVKPKGHPLHQPTHR